MANHKVICADDVSVDITLDLEENPVAATFGRLEQDIGIPPGEVLQAILGDFDSSVVVFDLDPETLGAMVLSFEAGVLHVGTKLGIARPQRGAQH